MVDKLNAWSHNWMLALNYDKTKVVHRANSSPTQREFVIGDNFIDRDCYYRYLGFEFCDTLGHNHGVIALNRAAIKALGSFTSKYFALDGTSYDVYKNIYDSSVCPVMDYASEIWGVKSYSFVNTIHNRAMRTYLGVGKVMPLPPIYGDMPWITPNTRHRSAAVRYWHRLTRMPESRLKERVFNWDYEHACRGLKVDPAGVNAAKNGQGPHVTITRVQWTWHTNHNPCKLRYHPAKLKATLAVGQASDWHALFSVGDWTIHSNPCKPKTMSFL